MNTFPLQIGLHLTYKYMATFPLTTLIYDSSSTSNIHERSVEFQSSKVTVRGQYIFWDFFFALPLFIY